MEKFKIILPYAAALILFIVISFAYFPDVLEGKRLNQNDMKTWKGGAREMVNYEKETGEHSFWTNSMFGGMPTYLVSNYSPNNLTRYLYTSLDLNHNFRPASLVFLYMLGFFIALLFFGIDPWLSIVGAVAFGFSSYFFIIIEAGHLTKVAAIAFMPPIIAGIHHAYTKNKLGGTLVMTVFLALQLLVNHLQITYYTFMIIGVYLIFQIVDTIKNKKFVDFSKASALMLIGAIIAVSTNFSQIITTYDYGKDSTRGKSELTTDKNNQTSGLDKDYATSWSYGRTETFNLFIPNLMGGASGGALSENSQMYKAMEDYGVQNPKQYIKNMPTYWGPQPFTSGPVYIGALVVFLFFLGLILVKGQVRWWIVSITALSFALAWGRNLMPVTDLFMDYFPGYNKFRTVSMILIIAEFSIPLLGFLALKRIVDKEVSEKQVIRAVLYSAGGLVLVALFFMIPGILSFSTSSDGQSLPKELIPALEADRASLLRADALRSIVYVLIGAGLIWAFVKQKITKNVFYIILGLVILLDLWTINKRYLNSEDFESGISAEEPYIASTANNFILKDSDIDFRVLNLTVSTFNDASTSYFHNSIGGYHGAKLERYQELIDNVLQNEIGFLVQTMQQKDLTEEKLRAVLSKLSVINMLNTKYIIIDPNTLPIMNYFRLGEAWFVENVKIVENANAEITAVQNFSPDVTAVVDQRFNDQIFKFEKDTAAVIELTDYKPNELTYQTKTNSDQLAVFSEIYYAKGWNAYTDGKLSPHFRTDYVLRAMKVPAGEHKIVFKFEPQIWVFGNMVSVTGSVVFVLFIIGGLGFMVYQSRKYNKSKIEN
jgi:uncharacterized membrane protein YfhO